MPKQYYNSGSIKSQLAVGFVCSVKENFFSHKILLMNYRITSIIASYSNRNQMHISVSLFVLKTV